MFGFLEENYLKPATLAEAVASELVLYGSKDVNYSITVNAKKTVPFACIKDLEKVRHSFGAVI